VNGNHVVAWRHVVFASVRHLLLGNNTIDLWKMRKSESLHVHQQNTITELNLGETRHKIHKEFL